MTKYFASPDGDDGGAGTSMQHPFKTVNKAVAGLVAGDELQLMQGTYFENVRISKRGAKAGPPIVIRPVPGHTATIDAARTDFLFHPGDSWEPVPPSTGPVIRSLLPGLPDSHPFDVREYVSRNPLLPKTDAGAFVSTRQSYTRLITHDQHRDLLADNQKFGKLPAECDELPGPLIQNYRDDPFPRRPWVYMGPGLWQDDCGYLHIRLSHTTHGLPGVEDYTGPTDPREIPLAIWCRDDLKPTLWVDDCDSVHIEHLDIRHGGGDTVRVSKSSDVRLDHLSIRCGPNGITIGEDCEQIRITNTAVDGGLPPWYFRSDRKDEYTLHNGQRNLLGKQTVNLLLRSDPRVNGTQIDQCEFVNGHDIQVNGSNTVFSRNWIRNINDDGMFVGKNVPNLRIRNNVVEQCLMALSVATTDAESAAGEVYYHRNLVDLRLPIVARRPHPCPEMLPPDADVELDVMEFGRLFKSTPPDPEVNLSHNTVLHVNAEIVSSFNFFRPGAYDGQSRRRAYNNIFVAINGSDKSDLPIAFLPAESDKAKAKTDGNCYFRMGLDSAHLMRVRGSGETFDSVTDLQMSAFGTNTGYEANGIGENPRLRRYWLPPDPLFAEDLRLADGSPCKKAGVPLAGLPDLGDPPLGGEKPDIGCYFNSAQFLEVGVDGRRRFPAFSGGSQATPG